MGLAEQDRKQLIADFYSNSDLRHPRFYMGRGVWYQERGDLQLALEDFRTAADAEDSDFAKRRIVLLLLRQGKTRDAIEELPDIDDLDTSSVFLRNASLYAYADEESLYRQLCQRMLERVC